MKVFNGTSVVLKVYDLFYHSYGGSFEGTAAQRLMKDAIGMQRLKQLSQQELAEFYCEELACTNNGARPHPVLFRKKRFCRLSCP